MVAYLSCFSAYKNNIFLNGIPPPLVVASSPAASLLTLVFRQSHVRRFLSPEAAVGVVAVPGCFMERAFTLRSIFVFLLGKHRSACLVQLSAAQKEIRGRHDEH